MLGTALLVILLLLLLVFLFVMVTALTGFLLTGVPFISTPKGVLLDLFSRLPLKNGQVLYDLGSGDGTVLFTAEEVANVKAVGFERTLWAHFLAKLKAKLRKSGAEFSSQDFFSATWVEADIIYTYLFPSIMAKVEVKFINEARSGARLVACDFALPNLHPIEVIISDAGYKFYVYQK